MAVTQGATSSTHSGASPVPHITLEAFCETQDLADMIGAAAADRRMERAQAKVMQGGTHGALQRFRGTPTPNLIVLEVAGHDGSAMIRALDELAECCDSGTKVIVVGHVNDVVLYRELIRRGVSDYLIAPLSPIDFITAVCDLYRSADAAALGRTIAVTGAKGGVGASTIAHNLAWSIAHRLGIATVIADLDLGFGTVGLDFNQDPPQGIAEAVFSPERLDANFLDRLLSKCSETLHMLAAPATLDRIYDLTESGFDQTIDLLRASTPCIVLDVPHVWTGWSRRQLAAADDIVIVASPDLANLRNIKGLVEVLHQSRPHDTRPRIVQNMAGVPKRPEISLSEWTKALGCTPDAVIGFDPHGFGTAANNGQMICELQPGGKATVSFEALARDLTGRTHERKTGSHSLFTPILNRLGRPRAKA